MGEKDRQEALQKIKRIQAEADWLSVVQGIPISL